MSVQPEVAWVTAEMLAAMPEDGMRHELVKGRVFTMPPAKSRHGLLVHRVLYAISAWLEQTSQDGYVISNDSGVLLARDPDTVRGPDGAYYAADRPPMEADDTYTDVLPDLVLEVVSPSDERREVMAKVGEYLDAGVAVVWVVWPKAATVWAFEGGDLVRSLGRADTLTSEALLPGFALPLERLFR